MCVHIGAHLLLGLRGGGGAVGLVDAHVVRQLLDVSLLLVVYAHPHALLVSSRKCEVQS